MGSALPHRDRRCALLLSSIQLLLLCRTVSGELASGPPPFRRALPPNTFVLLFSSVAVWWGERGVRRGSRAQGVLGLALAFILGVAFLVVQGFEWRSKKFSLASNLYSSLFFTVTGFHMAHVIVGVLALAALVAWTALGYFDGRRNVPVLITTAYWHFVDIVWLFVFATFYVSPYVW